MRSVWAVSFLVIAVILAAADAAAHGGAPYRGPGSEVPPPVHPPLGPPPPPDWRSRLADGYAGPTWEEWRRLTEPRGRARRTESLAPRVESAFGDVTASASPALANAIACALERYRPLPNVPDSPSLEWSLSSFGSRKATVEVRRRLLRGARCDAGIERWFHTDARAAIVLVVAGIARELTPRDPRRGGILSYLRARARASSPGVRKLALLELALIGRGAPPDEFASIREQLRFHAEGGPFGTRPFAAHALRELIAPEPKPIVDADRLLAIAVDTKQPEGARIDAVRRLGRVGPYAAKWEERWVLPWLAGARHPEIDRRVAER